MSEQIKQYSDDIKAHGKATKSHDVTKNELQRNKQINQLLNEWACDFPRQTTAYEIKQKGVELLEKYNEICGE